MGIFGLAFEKILSYLISASFNLSCCKVWCKNKNPEIWDQKYLIWIFFGLEFENNMSYVKAAPSNLCIWDQKCLIWVIMTKNAFFGYFWTRIFKQLLSYLKSTSLNLSICQLRSKNALFRYFWARTLRNYCDIWNLPPRVCLIAKFLKKAKMPNLGNFDQKCLI